MKKYLLFLAVSSILLCCNKETLENRSLLVGKWNWKSSLQNNGTQMLPRDASVTDSNFVVFTGDSFTNNAACLIIAHKEGNYKLKEVANKQILIFKSPNTRPDTFYVSVTNTRLDLKEVHGNYSCTHTFIKRDN
jgi:hypothetical protein